MMLETVAIGIRGFVGSQFNFAGDLYNSLLAAFNVGGITRSSEGELHSMQLRGIELIEAWHSSTPAGGYNGAKYFMNLAGVPVGDARLPYLPLGADGKSALKGAFDAFCAQHGAGGLAATPLKMCAHV
jgi:N-acetylneuraminate lyase